MIVLDTHIWVWWVHDPSRLPPAYVAYLTAHESVGLGISAISCWEVAKLVEHGRLALPGSMADWMRQAIAYPGIQVLPLTPDIAVASTQLPGTFHRDPADQIVVATARIYACPLVSVDTRILAYPHVHTQP